MFDSYSNFQFVCLLYYLCSSRGGCHCVIISDNERADPTNPTGGPDGAENLKQYFDYFMY